MQIHTASQIAKWFLTHNRIMCDEQGAEYISNAKLQKLLYYAQGCFLAVTGNPLFSDELVAWRNGPVVESVYEEYLPYGKTGIQFDDDFDFGEFSTAENDLLREVYDIFGQYSAWKLRDMVLEETPVKEIKPNASLSLESMKKYFEREHIE